MPTRMARVKEMERPRTVRVEMARRGVEVG